LFLAPGSHLVRSRTLGKPKYFLHPPPFKQRITAPNNPFLSPASERPSERRGKSVHNLLGRKDMAETGQKTKRGSNLPVANPLNLFLNYGGAEGI
jgi:hypothetical protein